MAEENQKQAEMRLALIEQKNKEVKNVEFKSLIGKNLVRNSDTVTVPESLVGDAEPIKIDPSKGADSPKNIPNDED